MSKEIGSDSRPGTVNIDPDNNEGTDALVLTLKQAGGTWMSSGTAIDDNTNIGADTKATTIQYYEMDGTKTYVRSNGSTVNDNVTTYNYQVVDTRTGAKIPAAVGYSHLHFGIWNGLKKADALGVNGVADLGIGFVAGLSDMTADMPNFGIATYNGNWVANVQAPAEDGMGDISRMAGVASMMADFGKSEVDVMLTGLATLEGTIDGNTFSGSEDATIDAAGAHGFTEGADFEGNLSGGFFGSLAAEAGGVFDYASEDNEDGAFRGSFGGKR